MDKKQREFLIRAKKAGYAAGQSTKEPDGSFSSSYSENNFSFKDNWDGGEPFGGRERFSIDGKAHWMMVYYGAVEKDSDGVIPTLRQALSDLPVEFPVRGPKEFTNGEYVYLNDWEGDLDRFSGKEKILYGGEQVYSATYAGGLVNQAPDE